ncbi:tRNA-dihydrouridine synthase 3 [Marasmius crinis-equi]|uniref:tRNA-dihydrouridine(47) synthase [NAD(P)(+)] n=1 Tax=Marasmius crinis-equi TaxID=585013 RepID=A0ABR3FCE9_9AGAR
MPSNNGSGERVFPAGTAPVKAEYLIQTSAPAPPPDDDAAEGGTTVSSGKKAIPGDAQESEESGSGKQDGMSNRAKKRAERKEKRGANKGRRFNKIKDDLDVCWKTANGQICEFGTECRFNHDIPSYLASKPEDLRIPLVSEILDEPKLELKDGAVGLTSSSTGRPVICPVFEEFGECRYGYKCRYLGAHVKSKESETEAPELVKDEEKKARVAISNTEVNYVRPETQKLLRTKKLPFPVWDEYQKEMQAAEKKANEEEKARKEQKQQAANGGDVTMENGDGHEEMGGQQDGDVEDVVKQQTGVADLAEHDAQKDGPDARVRFSEKKRLDWKGKSYLAPLTTVGNLPFRRLCVDYGADITCGEMGLATSFLSGSKEEWSLVRRHPSEKIFGVQVAGNKPNTLVPTAEVLAKECTGNIDFVDVNCGCPIDLVFKSGSGSALLDAPAKLGRIVAGMNKALGEIPVTVKLRTGVKDGRNNAHKLMPRLVTEWGLHGRTRQQRYTKLADWEYIKQCVEAVRAREAEEDLPSVPLYGGGDCFSSQDYWSCIDQSGVDGVMVGRGALIKPWIFTEIKERREWDISSRERLEGIRKYAEYGLCHFGSDTAGINASRRYLCEALSFQYRYVPIGLLERLPGRINDRAPAFKGRDELETLLASPDSRDWVKISEMFLGPAPEAWSFTPKHKSNAYESQG